LIDQEESKPKDQNTSPSLDPKPDPLLHHGRPPHHQPGPQRGPRDPNFLKQPPSGSTSPHLSRPAALTFGGVWADLFDQSLARKLGEVAHLKLGDPKFKVSADLFHEIGLPEEYDDVIERLNASTQQSSELIWKFTTLIHIANIVFVDTKLLDTAIGQFLLATSKDQYKECWAVGVDAALSPLAPAYLKGVLYPNTPDMLVELTLKARK
jgi:hypothetical protein